jgi:hypothetical protein
MQIKGRKITIFLLLLVSLLGYADKRKKKNTKNQMEKNMEQVPWQ